MKRLSIVTAVLVMVIALSAQTFGEIGAGTASTNLPSYALWGYSWSSAIYASAGFGGARTITQLAFNEINAANTTLNNQKIYLKETTSTSFSGMGYEDPANNGYTLVYNGPVAAHQGWVIIDITDFNYSGNSNLIVHWENRHGTALYSTNWYSTECNVGVVKCSGSDTSFPAGTGSSPFPIALPNLRYYYSTNNPATPSNPVPANGTTGVSVNSSLSFTLGTNTTGYQVWTGTSANNLTQVHQATVTAPGTFTYTPANPWQANTQYFWKVVATNSTGSTPGQVWNFTAESVIGTLPYNQGFEGAFPPTGWTNTLWTQDTGSHSGTGCAKISYLHTGVAILQSPLFTLPASPARLKFWWSDGDWIDARVVGHDTTFCEISVNGSPNWTNLATFSAPDNMTAYQQADILLAAYAGQSVNIRFRDVSDGTINAYGFFLDDILIEQIPAEAVIVINPTSLTYAQTVAGAVINQTVSITNQGSSPLVITSVTPNGVFSATNPGTINAGQTAVSTVSFAPQVAGQFTGTVTYNIQGAFTGVNTVQLSGSAYAPYTTLYQNFDASTIMPTDWSTIVVAQSTVSYVGVRTSTLDAHSGTNFIKMYNAGDDITNAQLILVTPGLSQLSDHQLKFYAKSSWGTATDIMILGTISNPADAATFTPLQTLNLTEAYQQFTYTFTPATTNKFIAFKHGLGDEQNYSVYIDDISWEGTGTVPNPAVAVYPVNQATSIRIKYVDKYLSKALSWSNGGGSPTGYKLYFGETNGFELINGTNVNAVTSYPLTLTLAYNTTYYWKIVPYNADGDAVNCPTWSFTTQPDPTVAINSTSFLNEGFEQTEVGAIPLGWESENLNNDSAIWSAIANSATATNSHTGQKAMHIPFGFLTPHNDWLYTPPLQLQANTTYKLEFWYNTIPFAGDPCVEKLEAKWGVLPSSAAMNGSLFYNDNLTNTSYQRSEQTFTPNADGSYFVGFRAFSDQLQFVLLIDDIKVSVSGTANDDNVISPDLDAILGAYPNPFSPQTMISYQMKADQHVSLDIYNTKGQKVRTLLNGLTQKGKHSIGWNGKDDNGQNVANGVYFCRMQSGSHKSTLKLMKLNK